jgi:hypothetical protein
MDETINGNEVKWKPDLQSAASRNMNTLISIFKLLLVLPTPLIRFPFNIILYFFPTLDNEKRKE